jgi:hypothetical protein
MVIGAAFFGRGINVRSPVLAGAPGQEFAPPSSAVTVFRECQDGTAPRVIRGAPLSPGPLSEDVRGILGLVRVGCNVVMTWLKTTGPVPALPHPLTPVRDYLIFNVGVT